MKRVNAVGRARRGLVGCVVAVMSTVLCLPVVLAADGDFAPQTLADYERQALKNHPSLQASYENWRAAKLEREAIGAGYPQPTLSYGLEAGTFWTTNPGLGHTVMLSQEILLPGRRAAWARPAELRGEAEQARLVATTHTILLNVRTSLIEIARLNHHLEVFEKQQGVFSEALNVVEALMATGQTSYADVLRLSLSSEMLMDRVDTVRRERDEILASLRVQLGLPEGTVLEFDFRGENDPLAVPVEVPELKVLLEMMAAEHPELRALELEAQVELAQGEIVEKDRWQGPTVGVGYMNMPGMIEGERDDAVMLEVSLPLPVFGRQISLETEKHEAAGQSVRAQRAALQRELAQRIESSVLQIQERQTRLRRYQKELIPMVGDVSERLLADIEIGRGQVTDFQLVLQQQLDLEMMLVDLQADIAIQRANLNALTGGQLEASGARAFPAVEMKEMRGNHE